MTPKSYWIPPLAMLACLSLRAQTASTSMAVSATVVKVCSISTTSLAFGNYTASSGSPNVATATVGVTCTNSTTYEVSLDAGAGTGATTTTRKMTFSSDTLNYQLFRDSGYSQNWGNSSGSDVLASTGTGSLVNHTVYGRIAVGQYKTPGAYADTVTVTVTY